MSLHQKLSSAKRRNVADIKSGNEINESIMNIFSTSKPQSAKGKKEILRHYWFADDCDESKKATSGMRESSNFVAEKFMFQNWFFSSLLNHIIPPLMSLCQRSRFGGVYRTHSPKNLQVCPVLVYIWIFFTFVDLSSISSVCWLLRLGWNVDRTISSKTCLPEESDELTRKRTTSLPDSIRNFKPK